MTFLTSYLIKLNRVRIGGSEVFFDALNKKFDLELIKDRKDITILRDSIAREHDTEYSLAPLLEDYLKHLASETLKNIAPDKIQHRYNVLKRIIEEEQQEKPFADVPEEERRLFRSMKDSITHSDKQALEFNLNELSALIAQRNKIYIRTEKLNKWSFPLAVFGLITSIIFGFMSLSTPIDYKQIEALNNKLVHAQQPTTKTNK